MPKTFDVLILTAFGQGYRLARDLAFEGRKVAWLDLTSHTKVSSRETAGPFCAAIHPDATDLDRREFLQDHNLSEIPQGFTVLQGRQIFEALGEVSGHQQKQWDQDSVFSFLKAYCEDMKAPQWDQIGQSFAANWFLYLAASFNKSTALQGPFPIDSQKSLFPVFSPTYVPQENFSTRKKREQDLRVFGTQILNVNTLKLRRSEEPGTYTVFDADGEEINGTNVVSFLSAWDLYSLDPTFYQQVYKGEAASPTWHWQRMEVDMDPKVTSHDIPPWLMILKHWDLPWSEENLMILRKDLASENPEDGWDLWVRVETELYAELGYRQRLSQKLTESLNRRFDSNGHKVRSEESLRPQKLQPFSLYGASASHPSAKVNDFFPCGADSLGSFDLYDRHRLQKQTYQHLHGSFAND